MRLISYYPRAVSEVSGVTEALWGWAHALSQRGTPVVVAYARGLGEHRRYTPSTPLLERLPVAHLGASRRSLVPVGLSRLLRRGDVLLLHEGWVLSNLVAAEDARCHRIPYIVVPHGAYEPGIRRYLKPPRIARTWAEGRMLGYAAGVHLFYESEAPLVRDICPDVPMIVSPTGMDLPEINWSGGGGYLAWIGRYDPDHKGIDLLLAALARIRPEERPRVVLHGPDYRGGYGRVLAMVHDLGLEGYVQAAGPIQGAEKWNFLRRADAYLHCSRWESHSIALMENLALGTPTLVTDSIHAAPALQQAGAAVVVRPSPEGIAAGIQEIIVRASELSAKGRAYVAEELSWDRSIDRFLTGLSHVL